MQTQNLPLWDIRQVQNPFPPGQIVLQSSNKLNEYHQILETIASEAQRAGRASDFLYAFLEDPKKYLVVVGNISTVSTVTTRLFSNLSECACIKTSQFNRFANDKRATIENLMIDHAENHYPKEKPLRYLSIGADNYCLQDFFNIGKLIKAGFQHIEAELVDSKNNDLNFTYKNNTINPMAFLQAVAKERGIILEISLVDNVSKTSGLFQIVQLIDFDKFEQCFNDVMLSHAHLEPEGRFFLAFGGYDFAFNTKQHVYKKIDGALEETTASLQALMSALATHDLVKPRVAMLAFDYRTIQWLEIVPKICQASTVQELALTILQPKISPYDRYSSNEIDNKEFTPENLSKFFTLLTNKPVQVSFCKNYEEFLQQSADDHDIVTHLFSHDPIDFLSNEVTRIRQCYAKSRLFFALVFGQTLKAMWKWEPIMGTTFFGETSENSRQKVLSLMN